MNMIIIDTYEMWRFI